MFRFISLSVKGQNPVDLLTTCSRTTIVFLRYIRLQFTSVYCSNSLNAVNSL